MSSAIELIEQGELLSLIIVAVLLYYVGRMAVTNHPEAMKWGYGISLLSFVAYGLFGISRNGVFDAEGLLSVVFRGLIAAGMMLGSSWIVFSAVFLLRSPVDRLRQSLQDSRDHCQRRKEHKQRQRTDEERKRHKQEEWERLAPEREHEQREQQQAQQDRQDDQYKREAIRLNCQLLYDQHAHELQSRFPRERLKEYFEQYLSDGCPPDIVEHRGQLLHEMLHASLEQTGGDKQKFSSLNEIAAYFQERKKEIESLDYDEHTRQSFLSSLNLQEDHAIREFFSS